MVVIKVKNSEREDILYALRKWAHGMKKSESRKDIETLITKIDYIGEGKDKVFEAAERVSREWRDSEYGTFGDGKLIKAIRKLDNLFPGIK